jgi:hypothetical protein
MKDSLEIFIIPYYALVTNLFLSYFPHHLSLVPSISNLTHPSTLQMVNTRNSNINNDNNQGNPPPPTHAGASANHAGTDAANYVTNHGKMQNAQGNQAAKQQQPRDKLGEFQRTKLPTFSHSVEPMDADD